MDMTFTGLELRQISVDDQLEQVDSLDCEEGEEGEEGEFVNLE